MTSISPPASLNLSARSLVFSKYGTTLSAAPQTCIAGIPAFATPEQEKMGLNFNDKKI